MSAETRQKHQVFGATWLAYASYYLGRKAFSASKHALKTSGLLDTAALGAVDTAYLAAYTLGQFASGVLGDRVGARRLVGVGLLLAALTCAASGSAKSALGFGVAFTLSGVAQASGWPGTTRAMAEWTTPENRGTVMGLWSTCYQVGPLVAGPLAGFLIARYGWRSAFQLPAALMALVALLVLALVRPGPRPAGAAPSSAHEELSERRQAQRRVLRHPLLWSYGASYFFIKFTRYALSLWLPFYLQEQLAYGVAKANGVAAAFEGGGVIGVIGLGALSDRFGWGRIGLSAASLFGLALALFAGAKLVGDSTSLNVLLLALTGACLFAPDSILAGAAAQDAGGRGAAAMATGFVNGVGSIGAFVEGLTVPLLAKSYGWGALFPCLVGMAVLSGLCLLPALGAAKPALR